MMSKRIHLIMIVKKNSLDNDCQNKKGGECECMNTWFWWCQSRIKKGCFKGENIASRLIQGCFNK